MAVLEQRVNPIPVVRRWAREFTASRLTARWEIRVAERARSLWALLAAAPGVLVLENVLVGAFRLFMATGAVEAVEALQWRCLGETSACRCWRLHWSEGANVYLLHLLLTVWHGGPVPACQGRTHMPGWDQEPHRRLVLVEGYVAGIVSAESGHVVGLNSLPTNDRSYIWSRFYLPNLIVYPVSFLVFCFQSEGVAAARQLPL